MFCCVWKQGAHRSCKVAVTWFCSCSRSCVASRVILSRVVACSWRSLSASRALAMSTAEQSRGRINGCKQKRVRTRRYWRSETLLWASYRIDIIFFRHCFIWGMLWLGVSPRVFQALFGPAQPLTFLLGLDYVADLWTRAINLGLQVLNGRACLDVCMHARVIGAWISQALAYQRIKSSRFVASIIVLSQSWGFSPWLAERYGPRARSPSRQRAFWARNFLLPAH